MINDKIYLAVITCAPFAYVGREEARQNVSMIKLSFSKEELQEWVKEKKTRYKVKSSRVALLNDDKISNFSYENGAVSIGLYRKGSIMNNFSPQYESFYLKVPDDQETRLNMEWLSDVMKRREWDARKKKISCV